MTQSWSTETRENRPVQQRSKKTEQALLDALERLLKTKSFQDLTVAQIASEAGVSTGAIYRRFKDKEDLLRSAFMRFYEQTRENTSLRQEQYATMPDQQVLESVLVETMEFTLSNVPLMRAANSINDNSSFELMTAARSLSARLLADVLTTSNYADKELVQRCKFVLRIATAAFRDTFLSGTGAVALSEDYLKKHKGETDALLSGLVEMSMSYLKIDG